MEGQILVVEDELQVRTVLKELISSQGYAVVTAKDGHEAVNAVRKQNFKLVFLDLRLPGLHGVEVMRRIKEINSGVPVVVISGYAEDLLKIQNKAAWPEMVIPKPFRMGQIREALGLIR